MAGATRQLRSNRARIALWLILAMTAGVSAVAGIANGLEDSRDLPWHEGRLLLGGLNPYAAYPESAESGVNPAGPDLSESVQLPSVLVMFMPVALLDLEAAKIAWIFVNFASSALFMILAFRLFRPRGTSVHAFAVLTLTLVASTPWRVTIGNGQYGLVAMTFFLLALLFYEKRNLPAVAVFASVALLKYTLVLPFFALFLYRMRDALIVTVSAVLIHMLITVVTGVALDVSPIVLVRQSLAAAGSTTAKGSFDLYAAFAWLAPRAGSILPFLGSLAVIGATVVASRRRPDLRVLSIVSIASIIIVYHRIYDAFVLLFLCFHLCEMIGTGAGSDFLRRRSISDLVEISVGALIVVYVFFADRLVFELASRGILTGAQRGILTASFACVIYAYLAFLFWKLCSVRSGSEAAKVQD